jgi:hypothetical protein
LQANNWVPFTDVFPRSLPEFLLPYMSSPCHAEVILPEKEDIVPKVKKEEFTKKKKVLKKKLAHQKLLGINFPC